MLHPQAEREGERETCRCTDAAQRWRHLHPTLAHLASGIMYRISTCKKLKSCQSLPACVALISLSLSLSLSLCLALSHVFLLSVSFPLHYLYVCTLFLSFCMCVCVCEREREKGERKRERERKSEREKREVWKIHACRPARGLRRVLVTCCISLGRHFPIRPST